MRALVAGGAGFIGSHLVDRLVELGHDVIVLDDFSSGKEANLAKQRKVNVVVHRGSIIEPLDDVFADTPDVVFHLAALPRVQFSIQKPVETHTVNVDGTLNLLEACRRHGVKRFVFSSSSSVYGDQDRLPLTEDMTPNPMSPYALQKLVGEHYCRLYHRLYGLETVSLRYFNVFGPRQDPAGDYACLIPKFIAIIARDDVPTINGDGEQTRDFTAVSDVVTANIAAATTTREGCFGEAFNVGAGRKLSVNEVTKAIMEIVDRDVIPRHGPPVVEPRETMADVSKIQQLLDWQPKAKFEDALRETIDSQTV